MVQILKEDPDRFSNIISSSDPWSEIEQVQNEAILAEKAGVGFQDRFIYRVAIGILGVLTMISAIGGLWLAAKNIDIPESVIALGSAAVGAIVGLFAKSPTEK